MNSYLKKIADKLISDDRSDEVTHQINVKTIRPVIWLLGKTGAGKTSLVKCLTGLSDIEIGNGFEPCTRTASHFDFPSNNPLVRFLDTRGLDETGYDAKLDLQVCLSHSHVLVVIARVDDPVQESIASAVKNIIKHAPNIPIIAVHNATDTIDDEGQKHRALRANHQCIETAAKRDIPSVETAMPFDKTDSKAEGINTFITLLAQVLPEAALLLFQNKTSDMESKEFDAIRGRVIGYASTAGGADLTPAIGAVAVPSIQAMLLRALGNHYNVKWTRRRLTDFSLALGAGLLLRFGGSYISRQTAKLIPIYGQTIGAIASGSISFATTYALGRSSAYYLHQIQNGKNINQSAMRKIYKEAFSQALKVNNK